MILLALLLSQLGGSTLNLNQQPIESRQAGGRLSTTRQYAIDCRTNMTCVVDGGVLLLSSSGGSGGASGPPVDAGFVVWSAAASTGSTNERVLSAGQYTVIDNGTVGQTQIDWQHGLTCAAGERLTTNGTNAMQCVATGGGGGSVNTATGVASFDGGSLDALTTVTAAWATSSSVIVCQPSGEEASIERLLVTVLSQTSGSFVVRSQPNNGSHWGDMPFSCIGN